MLALIDIAALSTAEALALCVTWCVMGYASLTAAEARGTNQAAGFFRGLILGPLGLIITLCEARNVPHLESVKIENKTHKRCQHCDELVRVAARRCRHCCAEIG